MALELFIVHNKRHHDLPKYYTKEAKKFTVGKLAQQLRNIYMTQYCMPGGGGYKFWTMSLDLL